MMQRLSPAKVNLVLHVLRKREDGYHDIASLMQKISLSDEMTFSLGGDRIIVSCPGSGLPENENNIVYKAAEALFSSTGYRSGGVEITITKRIPVAAGLGGGSSNAATSLVTLNEMIGAGLTDDELMDIGARIGADVPFFIQPGGACWAFGIGEKLQSLEDLPAMWFVLVNPRFEVSTKKVYESLKMGLTNEVIKYNIPRLRKVPQVVRALSNDLENVTVNLHPVIAEIKDILVTYGALGSLMSGSGPTVFGIFHNEENARKAKETLSREAVSSVFLARSL